MELINNLIKYCWDRGLSGDIYTGAVIVAFVLQFVFLFFYRKKYCIPIFKAVLTVLLVYPISYFWMLVVTWAELGFRNWGANNIIRLYIWVPLIALAVARLLKVKASVMTDYLAPSMALQQAIAHTVCPFAGCCHGYSCSWGIYNPKLEECCFPNQWLECFVAALVFAFLLIYANKRNYCGDGRVFPLFMITFGGTRFFLEFLRDNEKLFLGISELALWALVTCVIGVIWLVVLSKKSKSAAQNDTGDDVLLQ